MQKFNEAAQVQAKYSNDRLRLVKAMEDTETMAKSKINQLELEIDQQNKYFTEQEKSYEEQMKMLRDELRSMREDDTKHLEAIEAITRKNAELQISNRNS